MKSLSRPSLTGTTGTRLVNEGLKSFWLRLHNFLAPRTFPLATSRTRGDMLAGKKYIFLTTEIGIDVDSILFSTAAIIRELDNETFLISSSFIWIVLWRWCISFIITCGTHFAFTAHIMSRYLQNNFSAGSRRIATFSGILAHIVTFYGTVLVCEHILCVCVTGTVGYVCRSRSSLHLSVRKTGVRWAMLSFTPLIRTLV